MQIPTQVLLQKWLNTFLQKRRLTKQYHKSKELLRAGQFTQIDFRIRQPKEERIYYFKINKQYRAWWYFDWDIFIIFTIDDHQN